MPDVVIDMLMADFSGAEFKTLIYIIRRTFGFKKDSDYISLSQMVNGIKTRDGKIIDRGTGLNKDSVVNALKVLEGIGIIKKIRRRSPEKGDETNYYTLNLNDIEQYTPVGKNDRGCRKILLPPVEKSDTQYTVLQQTDKTVNVTETEFKSDEDEEFRTEALVEDILEVTKDKKSKGFYRKVVKKCPDAMIYRALSEVKDTDRMGKIKKSPGAYFTSLIQKHAEEQGITI
ncbi:MAG: replication protein [Nitrospirae bacterium]|nr:replication protein [Nitrospirota bacterium]